MASFNNAIGEMKAIEKAESNGFPTKRNHAGNQQNYVPSGEDGGEYTYDAATFHDDEGETATPAKPAKGGEGPKDGIKVSEGDGKPIDGDFDAYVDSQNFRQDFKDQLKSDFKVGNDKFQKTLSAFVKRGDISIKRTSGLDCCEMRGIVNISKQSGNENRVKGEVFWHENCHGIDFQSMKDLPSEKLQKRQYSGISEALSGFTSAAASTRYMTSNGKTMLETLKDEMTSLKREKKWDAINDDFNAEVNSELQAKFPEFDVSKYYELRQREVGKIDAQLDEEFKGVQWGSPEYANKWKRRNELIGANETLKRLEQANYEKAKIKNAKFKSWGGISDMFVAGDGYAFCGGHSSSYFKRDKSNKALEFFAEYGSATATGDTETLSKFKKYFPQTSKAADEVIEAIHKYTKGRKE